MGSKPSCLSKGELVHSQTPPISPCPANLLPWPVTATGCQWAKPTLASCRFVKSSGELPTRDVCCDGGLSSTPSLSKCLVNSQQEAFARDIYTMHVPIDSRDFFLQFSVGFDCSQMVDMAIDAAHFLGGRNSAAHPLGATREFIIRCKYWPVQPQT